jgi:hypothetical protein
MQKTIATIIELVLLALLSSCGNSADEQEIKVVGAKGRFFATKTDTSIPLSDDTDSVYYLVGPKKQRIFRGSGGKSLGIFFDSTRKLAIITYCGGRIESIESSFSDTLSTEGTWEIYRTQVVNNPGFSYGGTALCS